MDIIQGQLSGAVLDTMSKELGSNPMQTASAAQSAVSLLLGALNQNSNSQDGASALSSALNSDHDGSIFNDLLGAVSGALNPGQNRSLNGAGILGHILGARQNPVVDMLGKMTGMDQSNSGKLLMMLAPVVMGALGKAKKEQRIEEPNLLSDLLTQNVQTQRQRTPQMSMMEKLLDRDGDGNTLDDIINIGGSLLGGFLKK